MGDVFVKAVERIEQRTKKAKMVAALAPLQVGIGVPGGAAVASAVVEAILRADTEKHMTCSTSTYATCSTSSAAS